MKTREEIEKKIKELKNYMFMLDMKDRWTERDYEVSREWHNEIMDLKRQLEVL